MDFSGPTPIAFICGCADKKRTAQLARLSRLSEDQLGFKLDDYWTMHGPEAICSARQVLDHNGWMTVVGGYGTGKTFLLSAIVNEALARGKMAIYITMSELLDELRRAFNPKSETQYSDLWDMIVSCDVLALDEVDRYNPTPWAEAEMFRLADLRYREWRSRTTVFATNSFDACPEYLRSRMVDGKFSVIIMRGADVRPGLRRE